MRIQVRRGTFAQWQTKNPILSAGEPGFETDTGRAKIGTGATAWNDLIYINGVGGAGNVPANNSITNAQLALSPAQTFKGNGTGAAANPQDITIEQVKTLLGIEFVSNTGDNNKPISTATQNALNTKKNDSMSSGKLMGRGSAGIGAIEEISLGANLSLTGNTLNAAGGGSAASSWAQISNRPLQFISDYADFDAALAAIGTIAPTDLYVDTLISVTANKTIPANIRLVKSGLGMFNVAAGATLTINSMRDCGNSQFFTGAGAKIFNKGAVAVINLAWWIPRDEYSDITAAINDALLSCRRFENGGSVMIPTGNWLTDGNHEVFNYTNIFGVGNSRLFMLTANADVFYSLGTGGKHSINYDNFIINANYQGVKRAGVRGIVINADGGQIYSTTIRRIRTEVVDVPFLHRSTQNGEGICIHIDNCDTGDGLGAFRSESINSSQLFTNCRFHVTSGGNVFDLVQTGGFEANKCLFISVPNSSGGLPNSNSAVFKFTGERNAVRLVGCQDESIEFLIRSGTTDNAQAAITLEDNLIQSKIQPSGDMTIISRSNKYVWDSTGNFKGDVASTNLVVYSEHDDFDNRNPATGQQRISANAGVFSGGSMLYRSDANQTARQSRALVTGTAGVDTNAAQPFPRNRKPAFSAIAEVDTNQAEQPPLLRMAVEYLNVQYGFEFGRDAATGNLYLWSNVGGVGFVIPMNFIALKSPSGAMRKLILNDDGTISNVAL